MSITTYSELKTAVQNWTARDDLAATYSPDWITLAESEFNRRLRVRQMMVTQSSSPSTAGKFSLPTDFLAWRSVVWTGSPRAVLEYLDPQMLEAINPSQNANTPSHFSILGTTDGVGTVNVTPTSTTAIDFTYYQKVTSLSTSNTTNWLLSAHPDVYLAGSLVEGFAYIQEFDNATVWRARRDDLIEGVKRLDQQYRGPSAVMPAGATP